MLSVDEARARILASLVPVGAEMVPLSDAWGRVAAAPIRARLDQPPADLSAMDGYAMAAGDGTLGARLRVAGSAPAGHPWDGRLGAGEALRLFTGSVMPRGADAVVLQEDADVDAGVVTLREAAVSGRHVRPLGQDFRAGEELVAAGRRLSARDVGLIAAGNHPWVTVHRRPRVAILATGDEVALPGEPLPAGGIVSSNAHALAALARGAGADPVILPIAPDDLDQLAAAAGQAERFDLLLTTGGASVGDHDLMQQSLLARGMRLEFWKIAMRPGKPLMFGALGGVPVLGLPGNPVSALVTGLLFAWPAMTRLGGVADPVLPTELARLGCDLPENDHRADHLRATLAAADDGAPVVTPFTRQDSGQLRPLARAGALVLRAPHAPPARAGDAVTMIRLDARNPIGA